MKRLLGILGATVLTAGAGGCGGTGPATQAPAPTVIPAPSPTRTPLIQTLAPSAKVVKVFDAASAACTINAAYAGLSPIPQLPDCRLPVTTWSSIPANSLVTTSSCGEAWLDTECGKVYVFGGSNLQVSTCDPSLPASGSLCVTSGTAAWQSSPCNGEVIIGTPSGSIHLAGTWVSATYLPDLQLTLFIVLDGEVAATAVVDPERHTVAEPTDLTAGTFWFTRPGENAGEVAGLPARRAIPVAELPRVVRELRLESVFAAIIERARADGIDVSAVPRVPTVTVRLGGPQFASPEAADAVLRAFDWRSTIGGSIGQDDFAAYVLVADDPPRDLIPITADAEASTDLMLKADLFNAAVTWDPSPELDKLSESYIAALRSMQYAEFLYFDALDFRAASSGTAPAIYNDYSRDKPIIWLDYRP